MKFKSIQNRKAKFEYITIKTYSTGIILKGTEVKSILSGHGSLLGSFGKLIKDEIFLFDFYVPNVTNQNWNLHQEYTPRKLLLHKKEIMNIKKELALHQNYTLVPLEVFYDKKIKVTLALCFGRNKSDKREYLKERDSKQQTKEYL